MKIDRYTFSNLEYRKEQFYFHFTITSQDSVHFLWLKLSWFCSFTFLALDCKRL